MSEKRLRIRFTPRAITFAELVLILEQKWQNVDISQKAWDEMPPGMRRHFEERK